MNRDLTIEEKIDYYRLCRERWETPLIYTSPSNLDETAKLEKWLENHELNN